VIQSQLLSVQPVLRINGNVKQLHIPASDESQFSHAAIINAKAAVTLAVTAALFGKGGHKGRPNM
jgi:hypothetical protein